MIRTLVLTLAVIVTACGASAPRPAVASGEEASRWDGQACSRDTQCFSLWCANHECVRREP
jgi:hypothetical protein